MAILWVLTIFSLTSMATCEPPIQPYNYHAHGTPSNQYLPPDQGYNSGSYNPSYNPTNYNTAYNNPTDYNPTSYDSHSQGHNNEVPKAYDFGYTVRDAGSGNDYSRRESSDGEVTRGEYRVALPDGRTQIVTYHADWKTGFHADVRYEGEARYPEPQQNTGSGGYNYQAPSYSGSLTGFHGNHDTYNYNNGYP